MAVCLGKGCPRLVDGGGYCQKCKGERQAKVERERGTRTARGYDNRWLAISRSFLSRFPICGMRADGQIHVEHSQCAKSGRHRLAQCTDHIVSMRNGGTHDEVNLQALCRRCNAVKANELEGGFGRNASV